MPDQIQEKETEEDGASGTRYLMSYEVPAIQLLVGLGRIDVCSTKSVESVLEEKKWVMEPWDSLKGILSKR